MTKTSQKGFTILEVLLLIVVVGLVGGVSWYVYSQNKTSNQVRPTESQKNTTTNINSKTKADTVPVGWKVYTASDKSYTVAYPPDWKIEPHAYDVKGARLTSPDYAETDQPAGGSVVIKGSLISLDLVPHTDQSLDKLLAAHVAANTASSIVKESITVKQNTGYEYEYQYEGPQTRNILVQSPKLDYHLIYEAPDVSKTSPAYTTFKNIADSISIQ